MAIVPIATLKSYFETGDYPTQSQFADLIDTLNPSNAKVAFKVVSGQIDFGQVKLLPGTSADIPIFQCYSNQMPVYVLINNFAAWAAPNSTSIVGGIKFFLPTNAVQGQLNINGAGQVGKASISNNLAQTNYVWNSNDLGKVYIRVQVNSLLSNVPLSALTSGIIEYFIGYLTNQ